MGTVGVGKISTAVPKQRASVVTKSSPPAIPRGAQGTPRGEQQRPARCVQPQAAVVQRTPKGDTALASARMR
eukprot:8536640-Alexandrium_andersonii.AAC.1